MSFFIKLFLNEDLFSDVHDVAKVLQTLPRGTKVTSMFDALFERKFVIYLDNPNLKDDLTIYGIKDDLGDVYTTLSDEQFKMLDESISQKYTREYMTEDYKYEPGIIYWQDKLNQLMTDSFVCGTGFTYISNFPVQNEGLDNVETPDSVKAGDGTNFLVVRKDANISVDKIYSSGVAAAMAHLENRIAPVVGAKNTEKNFKELLLEREHEIMTDGITPVVIALDNHWYHITEHKEFLKQPNVKSNSELVARVLCHIEAHVNSSKELYSILEFKVTEPIKSVCTHQWQEYVGLTQRYDFCTLCDAKKS